MDERRNKNLPPSPKKYSNSWKRRRTPGEVARERVLKDWYGEERANTEIEALQLRQQSLNDILGHVLIGIDKNDHILLRSIVDAWEDLLGPELQHNTSPRRIKGKTLMVEVYNSSWRYQLEFSMKGELLEIIQKFSKGRIQKIQFITGGKTKFKPKWS